LLNVVAPNQKKVTSRNPSAIDWHTMVGSCAKQPFLTENDTENTKH
jgi:hypothetical protein